MIALKPLLLFCISLVFSVSAAAEHPMQPLLGEWVSRDGTSKQSFESAMDGEWLATHMWFKSEDEWKRVASGSMYRKPKEHHWTGVTRTKDMQGIVYFESRITPISDGVYKVSNLSFTEDGTALATEADWHVDKSGEFHYTIYQLEGDERTPWYSGVWVRPKAD